MAQKLQITFRGEVVGTRTTNRTYSHAIVAHDFDGVAFLAIERQRAQSENWRKSYARNHAHACDVHGKGKRHPHASVISPDQFAVYAQTAAMTLEAYIEHEIAQALKRAESYVAGKLGTVGVVCYCGRPDLASKALAEHRAGPEAAFRKFSAVEVEVVTKPAKV